MELPGGAVQLSWLATALSGVLVYQIKWMPLGEGKAHEVRTQGQTTFQRNSYGPRSQGQGLGSMPIPVLYLEKICLPIACESYLLEVRFPMTQVDPCMLLSLDLCPRDPWHSRLAWPDEACGI